MHYVNHNIKFWRQYKRYTQGDIADMVDATLGMIKSYETGTAVPQVETLIKIADMMNISLDTLIRVKLTEKNYGKQEVRINELEKKVNLLLKQKNS